MKRILLFCIFVLYCFSHGLAQETVDSVCIHYRRGYRYVELDYRDNRAVLEGFVASVRAAMADSAVERVVVRASASPDGEDVANRVLTQRRLDSLCAYLVRYAAIPDSLIERRAEGVAWGMLRALVADSEMDYRDEVLYVLDSVPERVFDRQNKWVDGRKHRLMALRRGEPYRYMAREFFPEMRSGVVVVLRVRKPEVAGTVEKEEMEEGLQEQQGEENVFEQEVDTVAVACAVEPTQLPDNEKSSAWGPKIRVKTNAVAWAMMVANAGVEVAFSPRFSIHLPVYYSALDYFKSEAKFRILATQPELRYWMLEERRLFAGVHFGVASYNFALGGKWRIQDHGGDTPALGGGLSVGYRIPLCGNRRWDLEFSLGAGAYRAKYDKFRNEKNGAYDSIVDKTFIGIDNAAVSFSYVFDLKGR